MNRETIAVIGVAIIITSAIVAGAHINALQAKENDAKLLHLNQQIESLKVKQAQLQDTIDGIEPVIEIQNDIHIPEEAMKRDVQVANADTDTNLLARIVHAEARGESYEGKVAVAQVVLNRVESDDWPNTIEEVVYQRGQFQPVSNGAINNQPNKDSVRASEEAMNNRSDDGAMYFYNPDIASDSWIFSRQTVKTIGQHVFAR